MLPYIKARYGCVQTRLLPCSCPCSICSISRSSFHRSFLAPISCCTCCSSGHASFCRGGPRTTTACTAGVTRDSNLPVSICRAASSTQFFNERRALCSIEPTMIRELIARRSHCRPTSKTHSALSRLDYAGNGNMSDATGASAHCWADPWTWHRY